MQATIMDTVEATSRSAIDLSLRLVTRAGEVDGTKVATCLAEVCAKLDDVELQAFFTWLVVEFGPSETMLRPAAAAYVADPSLANASRLTWAAEPKRQELLRRLNTAPQGTALIVGLRDRLLRLLPDHPELTPLDEDLRHLLASWFNRGFLELRRIDWNTPAAILEKLIAYEAVHAIQGWEDLRGRLAGDRRCYGFFHPALPEEPLIFVEVALTDGISAAIAPLLDHAPERRPLAAPTTAIFYSISNCQRGLRGVSFGNVLIKQITQVLQAETPSLCVFATLSPVPGFRRWLDAYEAGLDAAEPARGDELAGLCGLYLSGRGPERLRAIPMDPVAAFHLANGAQLDRINLDADLSEKGRSQGRGIMVNYRYSHESIVANHQAFVEHGQVAMSPQVAALVSEASARWSN